MADNGEQVQAPATGDGGEVLSKSEMKRRAKAEENAKKAAEKEAAKAAKAAAEPEKKKKKDDEDEDDLDPTAYFANRTKALEEWTAKGHNPYPHKFNVSMRIP